MAYRRCELCGAYLEWVMLVVAALIWAVLAVLFVGWWTV